MIDLEKYQDLKHVVGRVLSVWPAHENNALKSLGDRSPDVLDVSDRISALIRTMARQTPDGLEAYCSNYQFLCEKIILPEELHFRRNGTYRLSQFADALREVYSNEPFMRRYMDGLLISHVMWCNHAKALTHYVNSYLPSLVSGTDHLEIGPGHGLLLYFAAARPEIVTLAGWDVSPTSIASTRAALDAVGVTRPVTLTVRNPFDEEGQSSADRFDSIVLSEVLEHIEDPIAALRAVRGWLKPGGRVWVNVPANSPAPDHLFLVTSPEHACELVREAGFDVEDSVAFPMTGATLEKAARRQLSISCVVTARRSD